jgi:hypothetical protein
MTTNERTNRTATDLKARKPIDIISERMVAACQQIQRENPYGSKAHRAAYDKLREVVKVWKGIDIGEYDE